MAVLLFSGCGTSDGLSVSGIVSLDGRPAVAELLFEPVSDKGKREGQSVTINSAADGRFAAAIPVEAQPTDTLPCRIVIRIPRGTQGRSSTFDYDAPPDKVVELGRDLSTDANLTLLITQ